MNEKLKIRSLAITVVSFKFLTISPVCSCEDSYRRSF